MSLIVIVRNVSELAPVSDYDYKVLVGDGTPERSKTLAMGQVKGHTREDGWQVLIEKVLSENARQDWAYGSGPGTLEGGEDL